MLVDWSLFPLVFCQIGESQIWTRLQGHLQELLQVTRSWIHSTLPWRRRHICSHLRVSEYTNIILEIYNKKKILIIVASICLTTVLFFLSSIEGEYVPMEGDEVTYKVCPVPPKNIKFQAVDVVITNLSSGRKHETWSGQVISS